MGGIAASRSTNHSIPVNSLQVDMQTPDRSITNIMRGEVDAALATVVSRKDDATLAALRTLVKPKVELPRKPVIASSGREPGGRVFDPC